MIIIVNVIVICVVNITIKFICVVKVTKCQKATWTQIKQFQLIKRIKQGWSEEYKSIFTRSILE